MDLTLLKDWLNVLYIVISLIILVLPFLIALVHNVKVKKSLQKALEIAEAVQPYIVEAEKFLAYTGEEKKAYVMTKANQYAIAHNIKFNEAQVSEQIEKLVALTKQVNKREKDKQTAIKPQITA